MIKKLTDSKIFNIILAILIGGGLWFYVTSIVNNEGVASLRSFSVNLLGEDILTGKGLFVDDGNTRPTVNIRFTGSRTTLNSIVNNPTEFVTATVDLSNITEPGDYTLPVQVRVNTTLSQSSVTVEDRDKLSVNVTVSRALDKQVELNVVYNGTVAEGYRSNQPELTPAVIRVQGPEELVSQIQSARVPVDMTGRTKTFSGEMAFELVDAAGNVVASNRLICNADTVNVIVPVVKTQTVALEPVFTYGGGITKENFSQYVSYTVEPPTIQISGEEADIQALANTTLRLAPSIDLNSFSDSQEYQLPITLAAGLTNDSGVEEAKVTVKIRGLTTRVMQVEAENIEVINVPAGFQADTVTQTISVKVRGPKDVVETLENYQLRAVVDLAEETVTQPIQLNLQAKISLDGSSACGVIKGRGDHNVVVNLRRGGSS